MRIGHGYDVHKMVKGRSCILCGVPIPYELGPLGHSDADIPVHALMDAMLGAAALGDIGKLFPDDDNKYAQADSMELLKTVNSLINSHGFRLANADITVVAQKPKLNPYIADMRQSVAQALGVPVARISVKATTEEGLGLTGSCTAIASHAVVLLDEE